MDITHNNIYVHRIMKIDDRECTWVASIITSIETGLA